MTAPAHSTLYQSGFCSFCIYPIIARYTVHCLYREGYLTAISDYPSMLFNTTELVTSIYKTLEVPMKNAQVMMMHCFLFDQYD